MAVNGNTQVILHGIGSGLLVNNTDKSIVHIDSGSDVSIEVSVSSEDVFGGDSLFPILTFIKEKGGKISITNAEISLGMLKATQAAAITTGTKQLMTEVVTVATGTSGQLASTSGVSVVVGDTVAYKVLTPDTPIVQVAAAPSSATQFSVSALGVITFGASTSGDYVFSYYVTNAGAATATIKTNLFPANYEFRWKMTTEDTAGTQYYFDVRATNTKCSGGFTVDLKRGTATAPKLEFKILAPVTGTDFISYTIAPAA